MDKQNSSWNKLFGPIKRDKMDKIPFIHLGPVILHPLKGPTCKIFHLPRFRYNKFKES